MKEGLSILIPTIPCRSNSLENLFNKLQQQIIECDDNADEYVSVIALMDNKKMSIGNKRQSLFSLCNTKYSTIIDDDDDVPDHYIKKAVNACKNEDVDVITFYQSARINSAYAIVDFRLNNPLEPFNTCSIIKRPAWHCCIWKTTVAKQCLFENKNWGEDHLFSVMANQIAKTSFHIPEIMHIYQHDSNKTAAF